MSSIVIDFDYDDIFILVFIDGGVEQFPIDFVLSWS